MFSRGSLRQQTEHHCLVSYSVGHVGTVTQLKTTQRRTSAKHSDSQTARCNVKQRRRLKAPRPAAPMAGAAAPPTRPKQRILHQEPTQATQAVHRNAPAGIPQPRGLLCPALPQRPHRCIAAQEGYLWWQAGRLSRVQLHEKRRVAAQSQAPVGTAARRGLRPWHGVYFIQICPLAAHQLRG